MDGFLVLVRCAFSDLPLRLCATREEAEAFAEEVEAPAERAKAPGSECSNPRRILVGQPGVADFPVGVGVLEFRGGEPGEFRPVKGLLPEKRQRKDPPRV